MTTSSLGIMVGVALYLEHGSSKLECPFNMLSVESKSTTHLQNPLHIYQTILVDLSYICIEFYNYITTLPQLYELHCTSAKLF